MPLPWPYTFSFRVGGVDYPFVTRDAEGPGDIPWSITTFGAIPSRLSEGGGGENDGSNVSWQTWDNLHRGGMGAREASDPTRYAYARGVYCGDDGEVYLAPTATAFTNDSGVLDGAKTIKQVLPWLIPVGNVVSASALTPTVTLTTGTTSAHDSVANLYYAVTAVTASGEGAISNASAGTGAVSATTGVLVYWAEAPGATSYKLYRGTSATVANMELVTEIPRYKVQRVGATDYIYHDKNQRPPAGKKVPATSISTPSTVLKNRVLVLASNTTTSYLYLVANQASYDDGAADSTIQGNLAVLPVSSGTTPETSWSGTFALNSACIYQNRVVLPTWDSSTGTQVMRYLEWDNSKASPHKIQRKDLTGAYGHLAVADDAKRLWLFQHHIATYAADPFATSPEWSGPIPVGTAAFPVKRALIYGGSDTNDSALYLTKGDGLYRILEVLDEEGVAHVATRAEKVVDFGLAHADNGSMLVEHRGELYINVGEEIWRYTIGQVDSAGPNKEKALPATLQGRFWDGVSTGRYFYGLTSRDDGTGYQQLLETRTGEEWHQLHLSDTNTFSETTASIHANDSWIGRCVAAVGPTQTNSTAAYLLFAGDKTDGTQPNQTLYRIPIRRSIERLRDATGYVPRASGVLEFPLWHGAEGGQEKVFHWVQAVQDVSTLPNGATLTFAGSLDKSELTTGETLSYETYVTKTADANGYFYSAETLDEATRLTYFRQRLSGPDTTRRGVGLQLRMTMTRNTGGTITPVFGPISLTHSLTDVSLFRWTYDIEIADSQEDLDHGIIPGTANLRLAQLMHIICRNDQAIQLIDQFGGVRNVRVDIGAPVIPLWLEEEAPTATSSGPRAAVYRTTLIVTELWR
jgi:hypothetical protein